MKPTKEFMAVVRGTIWGIGLSVIYLPILFVSALLYFPSLGHSWKLMNWVMWDFREWVVGY
jgi:hypothetical protein